MKKVILVATLTLLGNISFGQSLQKGNLVGIHLINIELKPGVTMDQFKKFYSTKLIPAFEKQMPSFKGYIVKGIRGENDNSMGIIWLFKTEQARNKYSDSEGNPTDLLKSVMEKVKPIQEQVDKLGTVNFIKYTDWIVQ